MSIRAARAGTVLLTPLLSPLALACTPADETPPTIEDARFEDASTLVLSFSEPVAPVEELVPETHFRLEVGFSLSNLDLTAYYDLSNHFTGEVPGQDGALAEASVRHGDTKFARIEPGDDPTEVRLLLSYPIDPYVCETLDAAEALGIPAGIHLHYARGSAPRITDLADNELAEIGSWWVIYAPALSSTKALDFPLLDPRISIPCPGA